MTSSGRRRAALLSACAFLGCTRLADPCLNLPEVVQQAQILGVRVDPPEALADLASGKIDAVQARALVATPDFQDQQSLTLSAQTCAPDDAGCTVSALAREEALYRSEDPFTVAAPAGVIASALAGDPLAGFGGIRAQLQLTLRTALTGALLAEKTLLFTTPAAADPPNHGFEIVGLRVRRVSHAHHLRTDVPPPPDDQLLAPGDSLVLDRYDEAFLLPVLAPGPGATEAEETYQTTDLSGRRVTVRERIAYTFYTTFGSADPNEPLPLPGSDAPSYPRLYFDPANTALAPLPGEDPLGVTGVVGRHASTGTLWIVGRDGRGAEAWLTVSWQINDETPKGSFLPELGPRCAKN